MKYRELPSPSHDGQPHKAHAPKLRIPHQLLRGKNNNTPSIAERISRLEGILLIPAINELLPGESRLFVRVNQPFYDIGFLNQAGEEHIIHSCRPVLTKADEIAYPEERLELYVEKVRLFLLRQGLENASQILK